MRQSLRKFPGFISLMLRGSALAIFALGASSVTGFCSNNSPLNNKVNLVQPPARTLTFPRSVESLENRLAMTYQAKELDQIMTRSEDSKSQTSEKEEEEVPRTMEEAIRVFFFSHHSAGPTTVAVILAAMFPWRLTVAPITTTDLIIFFGCIVFWAFQEHFLHGKVLHSEFDWVGKENHEGHHDKPYFHISIDPAPLMLSWLGIAHAIFRCVLPLPLACSATLGYASAGLFYEWAHYIVHTKVKPRSRFMKRMRDNHIRHHCVDKRYWLGFSVPMIDDIFGTNPDVQVVRQQNKQEKALKAASLPAQGR